MVYSGNEGKVWRRAASGRHRRGGASPRAALHPHYWGPRLCNDSNSRLTAERQEV